MVCTGEKGDLISGLRPKEMEKGVSEQIHPPEEQQFTNRLE